MSVLSYLELTEITLKIKSKKVILSSFEEFSRKITIISRPSHTLNINKVIDHTTISSGAYYVPRDIVIAPGAKLTIDPGVILYFAEGKGIISYGLLSINGTSDDLIVITGDKWANISILGEESEGSLIMNTIIEGGNSRNQDPTYGDTFKSWNDSLLGGNIYAENTNVEVHNSYLINGNAEYGGGLFLYNSSINFENNIVFNNKASTTVGGIELFWPKHRPSIYSIVKNSYLIKNSGFYTGGLFVHEGNIRLEGMIVKHNISPSFCGGITISQTNRFDLADIRLRDSIVEENIGAECGGLYCSNFKPLFEDITTNMITLNSNNSEKNANFQQSISKDEDLNLY